MSKKIKELELNALRKTFAGVKNYVILEPIKVDSATEFEFRKRLREKKCTARLVKNTLARKVFTENGIQVDNVWSGPTLLVWGGDSVKGLSNAVDGLIKDLKKDPKAPDKFKEKTAVADGQPVTLELAQTLPTRMEAIGGVLAAVLGPGSAIAGALVGPANQLAGVLKAIEEKGASKRPRPLAAAAVNRPAVRDVERLRDFALGISNRLLRTAAGPLHPAQFLKGQTMSAVAELGDKLAGLTIAQAVELKNYLKEKYQIEPAGGG